MENWLYPSWNVVLIAVVTCIVIFVSMLAITRVCGLRTFSKMSSIDFAITICIGSVLSAVIMNGGQSIVKGAVVLSTLLALKTLHALLKRNSKWVRENGQNTPKILMRDGEIFYDCLKAVNVSEGELMAKLREANVLRMEQVRAVVFETTGDISVLHSQETELEEQLLTGVDCDHCDS